VQVFAPGGVWISRSLLLLNRAVSRSLFPLVGAGDLCLISSRTSIV
jgi:hypothetical protein